MKPIQLKDITEADFQRIIKRSSGTNPAIMPKVREIMGGVKKSGDRPILTKYQARYGKNVYKSVAASRTEIDDAWKRTDTQTIRALKQMKKNIGLLLIALSAISYSFAQDAEAYSADEKDEVVYRGEGREESFENRESRSGERGNEGREENVENRQQNWQNREQNREQNQR